MTEVGYASDKPSDCAYCYFFSAGRKKCTGNEWKGRYTTR